MKIIRHTLCLGALLGCLLQGAKAEALMPPQLREKGVKPDFVRRTLSFPNLSQYSPGSVACTISFSDFYFGYLRDEKFYRLKKWPFSSACYTSTEDVVTSGWARRGKTNSWQINFAPDDSAAFRRTTKIYQLSTGNAQGWAIRYDDEIGDESNRQRHLHYCLIREPKAICGEGVMGYLEDIKKRPKTDLTPYALQILRTIEFVDDSSKVGASQQEGTASSPPANKLDRPASSP
jgi:hypothetical protein